MFVKERMYYCTTSLRTVLSLTGVNCLVDKVQLKLLGHTVLHHPLLAIDWDDGFFVLAIFSPVSNSNVFMP